MKLEGPKSSPEEQENPQSKDVVSPESGTPDSSGRRYDAKIFLAEVGKALDTFLVEQSSGQIPDAQEAALKSINAWENGEIKEGDPIQQALNNAQETLPRDDIDAERKTRRTLAALGRDEVFKRQTGGEAKYSENLLNR